tara:strand:- start:172 stop:408 length:237 start_codon:yes stop_codon:yes gene_type:complete
MEHIFKLHNDLDILHKRIINLDTRKYYQVILVVIANDTNDYYCEMIKNYWIPLINYVKKNIYQLEYFYYLVNNQQILK